MSEKTAPNPNNEYLEKLVREAGAMIESPYTPVAAKAPQQVPSVGRVVHFVYGDRHLPAIITDPANGLTVHLTVFPVDEQPFTTLAGYDPDGKPASWHWPEYVPSK